MGAGTSHVGRQGNKPMNSRYLRPAPQSARMPVQAPQTQKTPMMQPLQWPTMNVPPPPEIAPQQQAGGGGLMEGLTSLGTAAVGKFGGTGVEAPAVNLQTEQTAPVAVEPPIPVMAPPEYGAPPVSPMVKKKPTLMEALLGGAM